MIEPVYLVEPLAPDRSGGGFSDREPIRHRIRCRVRPLPGAASTSVAGIPVAVTRYELQVPARGIGARLTTRWGAEVRGEPFGILSIDAVPNDVTGRKRIVRVGSEA